MTVVSQKENQRQWLADGLKPDIPEIEAAYLAAAIHTVRQYPYDHRYDDVSPVSAEMQGIENLIVADPKMSPEQQHYLVGLMLYQNNLLSFQPTRISNIESTY